MPLNELDMSHDDTLSTQPVSTQPVWDPVTDTHLLLTVTVPLLQTLPPIIYQSNGSKPLPPTSNSTSPQNRVPAGDVLHRQKDRIHCQLMGHTSVP